MDFENLPRAITENLDLNNIPRYIKRLIMLIADLVMIPLALWSAFALRLGEFLPDVAHYWWLFLVTPLYSIPIFARLGLYHAIVRFMGLQALFAVIKGVSLSALLLATLVLLSGVQGVPRSVFLIYWGVAILYIGGSRFFVRAYLHAISQPKENKKRLVIYGAGASGIQLATALINSQDTKPVAFIDDNKSLQGSVIHGIKVHAPSVLPELITEHAVSQVLLAMPSVSRSKRRKIVDELTPLSLHIRTIPGMAELISGKARVDELQEVDIADILGRDSIEPNRKLLDACIREKQVMVTGAGGSIGSELCRQIILLKPQKLILYEISEYALYRLERELKKVCIKNDLNVEVVVLLGSVQDRRHLENCIRTHHVDTVYHAAAYKHVPLVEHNISQGVLNNIIGTWHTAQAAIDTGVDTFVLISTDKAVRPTNVMGASKRFAEMVLQALSEQDVKTRFCMVRFGNVLDSSGSVVPLFREQIRHGGPVTVTHKEIIRYFMTIPEAAQLVIQAGSIGTGGDVFVLDMGEPIHIVDLARKMIHLMGLEVKDEEHPEGDIEIEYTGLRPGEKLYEELLIGENAMGTQHPQILRAEESFIPWPELLSHINRLEQTLEKLDDEAVRQLLVDVVSGYVPNGDSEGMLETIVTDQTAKTSTSITFPQEISDPQKIH